VKILKKIVLHPALLLAAGNTALAFESAELIAISLNICLVVAILFSRWKEVLSNKPFGVSFTILALVNFFTACSVVYTNLVSTDPVKFLDFVAAIAFVAWGVGHLLAGRLERHSKNAKRVAENPQFFYGIGDMSAVNASGSLNPYSFPFMIIGFVKSIFIGKSIKTKSRLIKLMDLELTSARIYGIGFFIGALTSLTVPYFVVAQLFWGLAYFQFKKDT
jgi:hypothetical protein